MPKQITVSIPLPVFQRNIAPATENMIHRLAVADAIGMELLKRGLITITEEGGRIMGTITVEL